MRHLQRACRATAALPPAKAGWLIGSVEKVSFPAESADKFSVALGNLQWRDFALDPGAYLTFRYAQIV